MAASASEWAADVGRCERCTVPLATSASEWSVAASVSEWAAPGSGRNVISPQRHKEMERFAGGDSQGRSLACAPM